jgi:hypothetical protein
MSPESKLYGRLTVGANRSSIGHAPLNVLLVRASQEIQKAKHREEMIITLEMSPSRLPDSTVFDKAAIIEQQLSNSIVTDPNAESPFPGITVGRVAQVMMTPEYVAYAAICEPDKRMTLHQTEIDAIRIAYKRVAGDAMDYFPKWVD